MTKGSSGNSKKVVAFPIQKRSFLEDMAEMDERTTSKKKKKAGWRCVS